MIRSLSDFANAIGVVEIDFHPKLRPLSLAISRNDRFRVRGQCFARLAS